MHFTLFNLAGFAILAWLLLILLPTWRVTRWLAESAVFPIYLCILYAVGIAVILVESGLGLMAEFGSAEGVLRILSRPDVALIAWIHILAFDQFVGLYIYRDNMRRRYLPIPLQSVLLILTLMLGPLGLLTYYIVRGARRAARAEPILRAVDPFPDLAAPAPTPPAEIMAAFGTAADSELDNRIASLPSPLLSPVRYMLAVFGREERALTLVGLLGIALAAAVGVVALVHGPVIDPEGVLSKPISFNLAVGIYTLSLVLMVPIARFSLRTLRRWRIWALILTPLGYTIETVQSLRGLDPRFSRVAGPLDQMVGGVFFGFAIGMITLFFILGMRFFDVPRPQPERNLVLAIRYAFAATMLAFAAGMVMSVVVSGRFIGQSGNLLTLHALGFHGLQAIPLVAILVTRAGMETERSKRWIHAAGMLWVAACFLVGVQTAVGMSIRIPTIASGGAALLLIAWLAVAGVALIRSTAARPPARPARPSDG